MFESSLQTFLISDTTLCSFLSTYSSSPSIFSEYAPEKSIMPYLIYRIQQTGNDNDLNIAIFNIYFDFYAYDLSRVDIRSAIRRLIIILERKVLEHDRFNYIRFYYYNGSPILDADPRSIHYNLQFNARAGRKEFIDYLTT